MSMWILKLITLGISRKCNSSPDISWIETIPNGKINSSRIMLSVTIDWSHLNPHFIYRRVFKKNQKHSNSHNFVFFKRLFLHWNAPDATLATIKGAIQNRAKPKSALLRVDVCKTCFFTKLRTKGFKCGETLAESLDLWLCGIYIKRCQNNIWRLRYILFVAATYCQDKSITHEQKISSNIGVFTCFLWRHGVSFTYTS